MCDARFVSFGQTFGNLCRNFDRPSYRNRAGIDQLAQRLAFDQLHRDVMGGTFLPKVVDRNDVGMIERRCRARFPFEAVQPLAVGGNFGWQNLDCYRAAQARILCAVNLTHAAGSQQGFDLIGTKVGAWLERHTWLGLYPWKSDKPFKQDK